MKQAIRIAAHIDQDLAVGHQIDIDPTCLAVADEDILDIDCLFAEPVDAHNATTEKMRAFPATVPTLPAHEADTLDCLLAYDEHRDALTLSAVLSGV